MSVDIERRGATAIVTLNRPEARNALDPETISGIGRHFADAEQDDAVRAVILTGAGDRAFCAGMDLKAFAAGRRGGEDEGPGLEIFMRDVYPKPVIAAVNGAAVAGGFELMLACDLVVAAEHAVFGIPEVKRGLVAAGGGSRLPERIPFAVALELGLTGNTIDAARALDLGLVNRVVPAADLLEAAIGLTEQIASNGPLAVRLTKELMYDRAGSFDWDEIREKSAPIFDSEDAREGATAFAEKRAPVWKGR